MTLFKFIIPTGRQTAEGGVLWDGCLAMALAGSEAEARALVEADAAAKGCPCSWLAQAEVRTFDLTNPTAVAFVMAT